MPSGDRPKLAADLRSLIARLTQEDPREAQFDARLQLILTAIVRRLDELEAEREQP